MIKYFIIFTAIGLLIGRLSRLDARLFYIAIISLAWGAHTEFIWGLAAMGELFLGSLISRAIWNPDGTRQTHSTTGSPANPLVEISTLVVFRAKTLAILDREMHYVVDTPGSQQEVFNKATRGAHESGLNEYDAAIAFMLIQLKSLFRPLSDSILEFYIEKLCDCKRLTPMSTVANEFLEIYIVDHQSDFTDPRLDRPELAFVSNILKERDIATNTVSGGSASLEDRLSELRSLREKGLISEAQHELKSREILRNL